MLLSFAAVSVGPLFEVGDVQPAQVIPRLVIVAAYLLVAIDLQFRGERPEHIIVLLLPLLAASGFETAPISSDVASGLTVGAIALSAARQLRPLGYLAVMVPAGVAHASARILAGGQVTSAVSDVVVGIGTTYAVYAFAEALYRAAERAEEADAETTRQREAVEREDVERRAVAAAGQALHDEVLVALRIVGDASHSRDRARQVCARAVEAVAEIESLILERTPTTDRAGLEGRRLIDLAAAVEKASPVAVHVSIDAEHGETLLPKDLYDVIMRATGESLRNVKRHSGTDHAELRLTVTGGQLEVLVVDRGIGRPETFRSGYGTVHSIMQPLADVDGTASIRPTSGGGTTVDLRVPLRPAAARSELARSYDLTVRATGTARPIHAITWPVAVVWIYTAIRYSFDWPAPGVSLLLAVAYVAATAMVIIRITSRRPTVVWLVLAATGLLILDAVSLALAPDGSLLDYRSWTMGFLAAPLVALTMTLPTRLAVAVLAAHPLLIMVVAHVDPALTAGALPWGSVNAVLATPIAAIVLGRLLRRIGRRIEDDEARSMRLSVERSHRQSMASIRNLHLEHTRRWVMPWLEAISDGDVDPLATGAAEKAALLAAEVRDDLYAPGFLHGELRSHVTSYRREGGRLTLRPGFPPGVSSDVVHHLLGHLLTVLDPRHRITITPQLSIAEDGHVRFAIVPPAPAGLSDKLDDYVVDTDPYRTVITLPVGAWQPSTGQH